MKKNRSPPWKIKSPSNYSELKETWEEIYRELHIEQGIKKTSALNQIAKQYGVSRHCLMYALFPEHRKKQKNFECKKWSYEKADPEIHKKRIDYKANYMATRRHIDEYIHKSFQKMFLADGLSLECLSYCIHEQTDIFLSPKTIAGLARQYESRKGYPLLTEVTGESGIKYYRLNK